MPLLKNYYGTGGDLNVDEIHDVIPVTQQYGLLHPQEGVVRGHFGADNSGAGQRIKHLQEGVTKVLTDNSYTPGTGFTVADMITGYGVAESVRHYYELWGGSVKGKRTIIQGWGNVASAAGYYLTQMGAVITGIIDRDGGIVNAQGIDFEGARKLFLSKDGNKLNSPDVIPFEEVSSKVWNVGAEIFIPAAASRLVTKEQIDAMAACGLEVIACGANVPFADKEIFFGPVGEYADNKVSIVPDFISNCGMARVFAYLMGDHVQVKDDAIFSDVSKTIRAALEKTHAQHPEKTGIAQAAFSIALKQLV